MKKVMIVLLIIVVGALAGVNLWMALAPQFGGKIDKNTRKKWSSLSYYDGRKFSNLGQTSIRNPEVPLFKIFTTFIGDKEPKTPTSPVESYPFQKATHSSDSGIEVTWFGHSSLLMTINGISILTDPVFSERTSPVKWAGTKRFDYAHNYQATDLPHVDYVLISHDHFDHLDYYTIKTIRSKAKVFIVPLGVKTHLLRWGVDESKIVEMKWWDEQPLANGIIACTPARHFSGRKGKDQFYTLWCSYVIEIGNRKVFFSGDSGYGTHFKDIGQKYGPFDLTAIECGQYNTFWPQIHLQPEETAQAHRDVGGRYLLPVHWGKYKLSLHYWTEPVDRLQQALAVAAEDIVLVTPKIGKTISEADFEKQSDWWNENSKNPQMQKLFVMQK